MKVTFVLPRPPGAAEARALAIQARELFWLGHQVFVVSQPHPPPTVWQIARDVAKGRTRTAPFDVARALIEDADVPHVVLEECRPVVDADVPDADLVIATSVPGDWVRDLSPNKGTHVYFVRDASAADLEREAS